MPTSDFEGTVQSRTGGRFNLPAPAEAEILALNPSREERLRTAMGWRRVEPGSLNLLVDEAAIQAALTDRQPLVFERPEDVKYPPGRCEHVPTARGGYRYYRARAERDGRTIDVLLRRPVRPIPNRAELYAEVSLRQYFDLCDRDGDRIRITVL